MQTEGSVGGTARATQRAPGAQEVHGTTLGQQVADGCGDGQERAHVWSNRTRSTPIPWFGSHVRSRLTRVRAMSLRPVTRLVAALVSVLLLAPVAAHEIGRAHV